MKNLTHLENHLRSLGFDNFLDIRSNRDPATDFYFLKSTEQIPFLSTKGTAQVNIYFMAYDTETSNLPQITSISSCFIACLIGNSSRQCPFNMYSLYRGSGQVPSKMEMMQRLTAIGAQENIIAQSIRIQQRMITGNITKLSLQPAKLIIVPTTGPTPKNRRMK